MSPPRRATADTWHYVRHPVYVKCKGSEKGKYLTFSGTQRFTKAHHLVTCTITLLPPTDFWLITFVRNHPSGLLNITSETFVVD